MNTKIVSPQLSLEQYDAMQKDLHAKIEELLTNNLRIVHPSRILAKPQTFTLQIPKGIHDLSDAELSELMTQLTNEKTYIESHISHFSIMYSKVKSNMEFIENRILQSLKDMGMADNKAKPMVIVHPKYQEVEAERLLMENILNTLESTYKILSSNYASLSRTMNLRLNKGISPARLPLGRGSL